MARTFVRVGMPYAKVNNLVLIFPDLHVGAIVLAMVQTYVRVTQVRVPGVLHQPALTQLQTSEMLHVPDVQLVKAEHV